MKDRTKAEMELNVLRAVSRGCVARSALRVGHSNLGDYSLGPPKCALLRKPSGNRPGRRKIL